MPFKYRGEPDTEISWQLIFRAGSDPGGGAALWMADRTAPLNHFASILTRTNYK